MKIHQLAHGARFMFDGDEYVKTGPMIGTGKHGQKLFPRHLELQSLDAEAPVPKTAAPLARDDVLRAFDAFCAECRGLIDLDRADAFAAARARFIAACS